MEDRQKTANDNSPAKAAAMPVSNGVVDLDFYSLSRAVIDDFSPQNLGNIQLNALGQGDAVGRHLTARDRAYATMEEPPSPSRSRVKDRPNTRHSAPYNTREKTKHSSNDGAPPISRPAASPTAKIIIMLGLWLGSIAALIFCLLTIPNTNIRVLAFIVCGWMSLGMSYLSKRQGRDFTADLGYSALFSSLIGGIFAAKTGYNIPISLPLLICILAYCSVIFAALLSERYFLTLSIILSLLWSGFWFFNLETPLLYWTFPFLWAVQMFTALRLRARLALGLIGLSGLFCLGVNLISLVGQNNLSPLMAICVLFAGGMTYARIGETLQDNAQTSGVFQTNFGWVIAALSALALQDYWLTQNPRFPWDGLSGELAPSFRKFPQWIVFLLSCTALIAVCNWSRMRQKFQGVWSSVALFTFAAILPASIIFQSQITTFAENIGMNAKPGMGLLIGGAITGLAITNLANGFTKGRRSIILASILALSLEAILVMDILYQHPNNILVFGFAVLVLAMTAGYIAHHPFGNRNFFGKQTIDLTPQNTRMKADARHV